MTMIFCQACNKETPDSGAYCEKCGAPLTTKVITPTMPHEQSMDSIPAGVKGWCWGGFLMSVFWGVRFRIWLALLALIPFVGIGVCIWLGLKGRELAWRAGTWSSVDEFNRVQRRWSIAGVIFLILGLAYGIYAGYTDRQNRLFSSPRSEIAAGLDLSFPQTSAPQETPTQVLSASAPEHAHDDVVLANVDKEGVDLLETRYGHLTTNQYAQLVISERLVKPVIQANSSLLIKESFRIGDDDLVIIENHGGTACPVLYNFVLIGVAGARSYPTFGTCSDIYQAEQNGNSVVVTMQGINNQQHRYIYANGALTENGKNVQYQPTGEFSIEAVIEDNDGYTNVRSQPNAQSTILGRVENGDSFQTHSQNSDWWKVQISGNNIGYIHRSRIVLMQQRF